MDLLTETQCVAIAGRYGISIDPADITQYKLIQVIKMHEDQSPAVQELIEQCHQRVLDRIEMKE